MKRLRFLQVAEDELNAASQWYDDQQRELGDRFLDAVVAALRHIEEDPAAFPAVDCYSGSRHVRRGPVAGFPCQVIFELRPDQSVVLAIAHGSRRPAYWSRRR